MKVFKFYTPDCTACKTLDEFFANELEFSEYEPVNAWEDAELASKYEVFSAPVTVLSEDNGDAIQIVRGLKYPELEELVETYNASL